MDYLKHKSPEMTKYLILGIITYLAPIKAELILVITLALLDWATGILKGVLHKITPLEAEPFSSERAIRKFFVICAYIIGLFAMFQVEEYIGVVGYFVKPVVLGITIGELQSLRENLKVLTGIDLFVQSMKLIPNAFKKK